MEINVVYTIVDLETIKKSMEIVRIVNLDELKSHLPKVVNLLDSPVIVVSETLKRELLSYTN